MKLVTETVTYKQVVPSDVIEAKRIAIQNGFTNSCIDGVGFLLKTLAAQVTNGKICEMGTGFGVGSSWILESLKPGTDFFTIDNDLEKVNSVVRYINGPNIYVVHGDWRVILESQPFDLLFADSGKLKELEPNLLFNSLKVGGTILLDDLTPMELWPEEWMDRVDPVRKYWLNHPNMHCTELLVTPRHGVIIGVKISN
jgi:predicted O-methyltransferase YrrM